MAASLLIIVASAGILLGFFWITGMLRRQPKRRRFSSTSDFRADDAQLADPYDLGEAADAAQRAMFRPWSVRGRS